MAESTIVGYTYGKVDRSPVTPADFAKLEASVLWGEQAVLRLTDLADQLGVGPATASESVSALEGADPGGADVRLLPLLPPLCPRGFGPASPLRIHECRLRGNRDTG